MSTFQKIRNNLFSSQVISVLGPMQYARYLASFVGNLPGIQRAGDLGPLDRAMGPTASRFRYRGSSFVFDCRFCDEHLAEQTFSFGIAREIYMRDCYFRWQPDSVFERARTIIDLGASRGAFSSLMTTKARFILCVDGQSQYVPIIEHNMRMNNFTSYAIEVGLVGAGGMLADSNSPRVTIDELCHRYNLDTVDLMKLDVEGSEFALFQSADWLRRINAISMEVHPDYGDPSDIVETVKRYGFACAVADDGLRRLREARRATFLYAWKDA